MIKNEDGIGQLNVLDETTILKHNYYQLLENYSSLSQSLEEWYELSQISSDPTTQREGQILWEMTQVWHQVIASCESPNRWMGRYLLGAKEKAARLITDALTVEKMVRHNDLSVLFSPNETKPLGPKKPDQLERTRSTSFNELRKVSEVSHTQCQLYKDALEQRIGK